MINSGMMTSNTDNWETPQHIFEEYKHIFNGKYISLDVCADIYNSKCKKFFSKEQDGLKQNWDGYVCWMNPPYGSQIGKWIQKASEAKATVVCLLPARTDTKWFHNYIYNKNDVKLVFLKGRLKFGGSKNSAPFPSMIVIFNNMYKCDEENEKLLVVN